MNFNELLKDDSIKTYKPADGQISNLLSSAEGDIQTANDLLDLGRYGHSRDTAYEAMLKSGMALMFSFGFRPTSGSHHLTIVKFVKQVLGSDYEEIITAFNRLRRTRNDRLYRGKETGTKSQAAQAITNARNLHDLISKQIAKR